MIKSLNTENFPTCAHKLRSDLWVTDYIEAVLEIVAALAKTTEKPIEIQTIFFAQMPKY